tara:strand:+ start:946 stop:1248 length:303 start_codon:yes stop_codon:yes gene_type:complete
MASGKSRRTLAASLTDFKKDKDKELERWARAMLDARKELDVIPKGWYTLEELADKFGYVYSGMHGHVKKLEALGKAEKKKFFLGHGKDGRRYLKTHYRLL